MDAIRSSEEGLTLVEAWRQRADRLDDYARRCRREGDTVEAMDAEQAATDYRQAADDREIGGQE